MQPVYSARGREHRDIHVGRVSPVGAPTEAEYDTVTNAGTRWAASSPGCLTIGCWGRHIAAVTWAAAGVARIRRIPAPASGDVTLICPVSHGLVRARAFVVVAATLSCAGAVFGMPHTVVAASPVTFSCTGAAQSWTVPAGITSAAFDIFGAQGGIGGGMRTTLAQGGKGGETTGTITVTPGEVLQVNVGCAGQQSPGSTSGAGGFNGGAAGGTGTNSGGGGGGGATDIRRGSTRLLVAGGGGGGGGDDPGAATLADGGAGGGTTGGDGTSSDLVSGAGTGGTQSAPGTHGGCQFAACLGSDGIGANGGAGGGSLAQSNAGGGGGGGYFGGGGGGGDSNLVGGGGGGGGSGFGPSTTANVRSGGGFVSITVVSPTVPDAGSGLIGLAGIGAAMTLIGAALVAGVRRRTS